MLILGIAGGTGSGKTTVVRKVMEAFPILSYSTKAKMRLELRC